MTRVSLLRHCIVMVIGIQIAATTLFAQSPTRVGTTAANFLEIGYGAAGTAMGDSYVSMANDVSSIYWNPAGLARMERSEVTFVSEPWVAGINTSFAAAGIVLPNFGTIGAGMILVDYGSMPVTTMQMQEGTGESFSSEDLAISLAYARNIVEWFSFGASAKMISSSIWHETATAYALDLGVLIKTGFFSPGGGNEHGLNIGMSISNYGTQLQYQGIDLLYPIDSDPTGAGNYQYAPGEYTTQGWELPLIFRVGVSITPIELENHELVLSADALHPNDNSESVNVGGQYTLSIPAFGKVFIRGGYKALFMQDSQYGMSYGFGILTDKLLNYGLKVEYAYRSVGVLGNTNSFGVSLLF